MKPERQFIAERALASHCPQLLRQGPGPQDLLPLLTRMGERLARRMSGALAPLLGGEAPVVQCQEARTTECDAISRSVASLAANSLFGVGPAHAPLLISIEAEPVLRIVDRAFGGKGEAPAPMPASFPMAAELMIGRIEALIAPHMAAAIAAVGGGPKGAVVPDITPLRRDGSLAMLAPFESEAPLAQLNMEVDDGGVLPWLVTIAMPFATLSRLFGFADATLDDDPRPAAPRRTASAMETPFADLPLPVSAVIVDMTMPFTAIARLVPGQILPVAVARSVPLRIGDHTFAHGTLGAVDDRVAVQITQAF